MFSTDKDTVCIHVTFWCLLFKVFPVIKLAEEKIRRDQIIPSYINISWIPYDDKCDAAYATISAIDAYAKNCSHIIFGPSCEYAVCEYLSWKLLTFLKITFTSNAKIQKYNKLTNFIGILLLL